MSYRRAILGIFAAFFAFLLWTALHLDTPSGVGAIWPLVFAILVVLMIPEKRFQSETMVSLIEALKGAGK